MPRSPKAPAPKPACDALPGYAISELNGFQCRFAITPHDAPSHRFCGDPTTDLKVPWCEHHQTVVFDRRTREQMQRDHDKAAKARESLTRETQVKLNMRIGIARFIRND